MHVLIGIVSRHGPDKNPLVKRLLESLQKIDPGLPAVIQIEVGPDFTKGEKRQRLFTSARARGCDFACILEDDTETLHAGWLAQMISAALAVDGAGIVNPLESRDGVTVVNASAKGRVVETRLCFGFCMLYSLAWEPAQDPRITYLDDLAMSLQCRAKGYRLAVCGKTMIRHSKEPFLRDDKPPWEQKDRERWGDGSSYYDPVAFEAQRLHETRLLLQQYGDMAAGLIAPDLALAVEEWRRGKLAYRGRLELERTRWLTEATTCPLCGYRFAGGGEVIPCPQCAATASERQTATAAARRPA